MGTVTDLLAAIADTGRDERRGGYSRAVYTPAELDLRQWFTAEAGARGLAVETDANGILWAWWDLHDGGARLPESSRRGALVTGSHLDSVPGGGVGIGNSLHAGQVIVADGTPEMRVRLERVLTNDPGIGVARHADAGYDIAVDTARREHLQLPMQHG